MYSAITHSIQIIVEPFYDVKNSSPIQERYIFTYHITIKNNGSVPIKLLKRKWQIYDVGFGGREVSGDGVIGMTPEIYPGEEFNYFSNVSLRSGVGAMQGNYLLMNLDSKDTFEVEIPKFSLITEVVYN
ncbi:Co2+/Mg2+ efflux protein ApaG [Elizabethkingia anophelis]|nr:Co2+/Mg2+ efflux protein ApaG [Elizabethkingia anophelis]MDV3681614.1 Co2+/Mg2+ efflux protein ApaG [Elizabethkingia anophelis]MDV3702378.1 Co2+/Mg2+ efflux protein ApaG [Elizabethkingia anophelis]MDV3760640.1 Co2+/Mg2+ efflux protein ApaG [Elizabethkingia anophelis]MDV3802348.1 Co2+/Mg2+ efflux protein ApaG [Elizabethkingia anophelis]